MGRLIDADAFAVALKRISEKQGYSELYMNVDDVLNAVIDDLQGKTLYDYENCPTVEAIPKEQYEARLKADMSAMLEELQSEIRQYHEIGCDEDCNNCHMVGCIEPVNVIKDLDIIQQKIDKLKS